MNTISCPCPEIYVQPPDTPVSREPLSNRLRLSAVFGQSTICLWLTTAQATHWCCPIPLLAKRFASSLTTKYIRGRLSAFGYLPRLSARRRSRCAPSQNCRASDLLLLRKIPRESFAHLVKPCKTSSKPHTVLPRVLHSPASDPRQSARVISAPLELTRARA